MPYGLDGAISINFQNSYGTSITTSNHFIPINDEDLTLNIEDLVSGEMTGTFVEGASYPGKRSGKGGINMDIDMDTLGICLRAIMGPATVTSAGGITTHSFLPRTSDFDDNAISEPLTIIKDMGDTGSASAFSDCVATELEFGLAAGELYKLKLGVMGGKFFQTAAIAPSFSTDSKWAWDAGSFSIDATGVNELMEITVKINETAEEKYYIDGTTEPGAVKRTGPRTIEVSGTVVFNDQTEYQEFINQSERALKLYMKANSFSIMIHVPGFKYTAYPLALSGPEQVEVAFSGKGKYASGNGYDLNITLVNTHGIY